jgi:hypothetical protein
MVINICVILQNCKIVTVAKTHMTKFTVNNPKALYVITLFLR